MEGQFAAKEHSSHPAIIGGGTDGNEQLTAMTSVILFVLLAVIGLTIVRIGQLTWLHLFLGLLLLGPLGLKMASTGYRFMRYYTGNRAYRDKGPPEIALRLIAPIVVFSTLVVFVSGIILLFHGPRNRAELLTIHKVSFIVWLAFTALHVLGHLPNLGHALRAAEARGDHPGVPPGGAGRWIALAGAIVGGLVVAIVLIPQFGAWTAHGALAHHHGHS
ncbi:MAG: hypothetical protein JOZ98_17515 [Solirubrobacterales bacterium]|nr:hypothetical protein [Solirubrobacterales bacterium]MBV9800085.1 hypothetical protein [Solirubrobacterales bacterium]